MTASPTAARRWRILLALVAALLGAAPALADEFSWSQGQPPLVLHPVASHWCVLTNVHGKMHGWGERVELSVENDRWVLSGASNQEGVGGGATCFETALLKSAGTTRMIGWRMARQWQAADECAKNPILAWWGDAFTAIAGFGGNQRGNGESLEVQQSAGGKTSTFAYSRACDKQVFAAVRSYFVGTPQSGRPARFTGPGGTRVGAAAAGEYAVRNGGGTRLMARADEAICYFTYIGGTFDGGGEAARIFRQGDRWALRAESKSGDGVWTRARCFPLDQRD